MPHPSWLPPEITLNGSSVSEDYRKLHDIFTHELTNLDGIIIDEKSVMIDMGKDKIYPEYERSFIHFVTRASGKERVIDYRRATKLSWVRPVLENYASPEVSAFYYVSPRGATLYLWLKEHDFAVILKDQRSERYRGSRIVVTAFNVDEDFRKVLSRRVDNAIKVL